MLKLLRGYAVIRVTGAVPESFLNRMTRADLPFWRLERENEFSLVCRINLSQLPLAEEAARRSQCTLTLLQKKGLPVWAAGLAGRPVLIIGILFAVAAALFLQNYVWFVQIEAPEDIPEELLRTVLAEEGVRFGVWGPDLDSQSLKNRMLNRIPELRWIGVNCSGGIATVLCEVRNPEPPEPSPYEVTNIVAARAGIITQIDVYNGFAAVGVGDAVTEGQLLVSGIAEWVTHTQATRSDAEVFADTFRRISLQTPIQCQRKVYTGREETCVYLILQNKRRKISGNSSIFGTSCDKMIKRSYLTLPGGYALPAETEIVTLREYRLEAAELSRQEAGKLLHDAADRSIAGKMIGEITSGEDNLQKNNGCFILTAERFCNELISRTVPVKLLGEEGYSGEKHQRREN